MTEVGDLAIAHHDYSSIALRSNPEIAVYAELPGSHSPGGAYLSNDVSLARSSRSRAIILEVITSLKYLLTVF